MDMAVMASAIDGFEQRLSAVGATEWNAATPCDDWDVRTLVNHVVERTAVDPAVARGQDHRRGGRPLRRRHPRERSRGQRKIGRGRRASGGVRAGRPGANRASLVRRLHWERLRGPGGLGRDHPLVGSRPGDRRRRSTRSGSASRSSTDSSVLRSTPGANAGAFGPAVEVGRGRQRAGPTPRPDRPIGHLECRIGRDPARRIRRDRVSTAANVVPVSP